LKTKIMSTFNFWFKISYSFHRNERIKNKKNKNILFRVFDISTQLLGIYIFYYSRRKNVRLQDIVVKELMINKRN